MTDFYFEFSVSVLVSILLLNNFRDCSQWNRKGKVEICNNSAAEFDPKFINITGLLPKSYINLWVESDFVKSAAILINLGSNSAAELLPISSFPLNSKEIEKKDFNYIYLHF